MLRFSVVSAGIVLLAVAPAAATDVQRTAKSGSPTIVYGSSVYTESCSGGPQPVVRVTAQPSHGVALIQRITYRMPKDGPCPNAIMKGTFIVYRSNAGFRGTDTMRYDRTYEQYSNGRGESWDGGTISVQVQ